MNVVIAYLDAMFSPYPQTPRLLEVKTELQGMMEDAYTNYVAEGHTENEALGRVIRDFGNLEEIAPTLGINPEVGQSTSSSSALAESEAVRPPKPRHAPVTLNEAQEYAAAHERTRFRVTTAVVLFVLSPVAILVLPVAAASNLIPLTDPAATLVGILAVLALVAAGVMLLVATSRETAPYRRITEGRFSTNAEVTRWAEALAAQNERGRNRALQGAIGLWILAPVPLVAISLLVEPPHDSWTVAGVVLVLVLVSTGLGLFLPRNWSHTVAESLTPARPKRRSVVGVIAAFYWPLLLTLYLAWSLIGNAWGASWMILPIGAALFAAIAAGCAAVQNYRRAR